MSYEFVVYIVGTYGVRPNTVVNATWRKLKKNSQPYNLKKSIRNYFLNSLKKTTPLLLWSQKQAYTCKEKILLISSSDFGLAELLPPSMVQKVKIFCETAEKHTIQQLLQNGNSSYVYTWCFKKIFNKWR